MVELEQDGQILIPVKVWLFTLRSGRTRQIMHAPGMLEAKTNRDAFLLGKLQINFCWCARLKSQQK